MEHLTKSQLESEIEQYIKILDERTKDMCVYPQGQDFDCCDCGLCRWVFFNRVREELRKEMD